MITKLENYFNEIDAIENICRTLPLTAAKHKYIEFMYNHCMYFREYITYLKMAINRNAFHMEKDKTTANHIVENYNSLTNIIAAVKNVDSVTKMMELAKMSTSILKSIYASIPKARHSALKYKISNYSKNIFYYTNDSTDVFIDVFRNITFNYQNVNTLFAIGVYKSNNIVGSYNTKLTTDMLNIGYYERFNRVNLFRHIYLASENVAHRESIMLASSKERNKILTGNTDEVLISTKFDFGFTITSSNSNLYENDLEEIEKAFKKNFLYLNTHVAIGGIEVICIPAFLITCAYGSLLTDYLENIHVFSISNTASHVVVVGNRKKFRSINLMENIDMMIQVLTGQTSRAEIKFNNVQENDLIFKSIYPSKEDVENAIENNRSFLNKIKNSILDEITLKTEEEIKHPLLPFSPGQLSLVLVSGKIDGVVDEGNNNYHLIKGSTFRNSTTTRSDGENEYTKTTTNAVATSVTILTANGEFKKLH